MYWFYTIILWLIPSFINNRRPDTYCVLHWAKVLLITYFFQNNGLICTDRNGAA